MNKKIGAALTAAATPILLFSGASAAHAAGPYRLISDVQWDDPPPFGAGLTVHASGGMGPSNCDYIAEPVPGLNPLNLPPYLHRFQMPPSPAEGSPHVETSWQVTDALGLPPVPTGTTWNVRVNCTADFDPFGDSWQGTKVF